MDKELKPIVSPPPHIRSHADTRTIMMDVIIALLPALGLATYVFGLRALSLTLVSAGSCVLFEWLYRLVMKKTRSIDDLSAVVTGIILAFCLPVTVPYWMPVIGAFFAIVVVKQLFGGIGKNFMNPALAAWAFLGSWPTLMNYQVAPLSYNSLMNVVGGIDAISVMTPMALLHSGQVPNVTVWQAFLGMVSGSLGEISAFVLFLGGAYLVFHKVISLRTPVSFILTVATLTFVFPRGGADGLTWMLYNVFCGSLFIGAIFMATDYSTSPVTKTGQIIFGVGCGLITVLIRYFGTDSEGVYYAILIMNTMAMLIDKATRPLRFGTWGKLKMRGGSK